jgi:hypothetical protein
VQVVEKKMFVRRGARLPEQLRLCGSIINGDWLAFSGDSSALEKQVRKVDWHFFSLREWVGAWGTGFKKESAVMAALGKALGRIRASRNTAEVTSVRHGSFLGLHYCQIRLAVRHIQFGPILKLAPTVGLISSAFEPKRTPSFQEFPTEAVA